MINHSTNINKTSTFTHWTQTKKRPRHMALGMQIMSWDKHSIVAGLNRLIGSQPSSLDNCISDGKNKTMKQILHRSVFTIKMFQYVSLVGTVLDLEFLIYQGKKISRGSLYTVWDIDTLNCLLVKQSLYWEHIFLEWILLFICPIMLRRWWSI